VEAAEAGLHGAGALLYAFLHAGDTLLDTTHYRVRYTGEFLDRLKLKDFITAFTNYTTSYNYVLPDTLLPLSCYFPDTLSYSVRFPRYWGAGPSPVRYDTLQITDLVDSNKHDDKLSFPSLYQDFDSTIGAQIFYRGNLADSIFSGEAFKPYVFSAIIYPLGGAFWQVEYELKSLVQGQVLTSGSFPDSGYRLRDFFYRSGGINSLFTETGASFNNLVRYREETWFSQNGKVIDSSFRAYYRPTDTLLVTRGHGVYRYVRQCGIVQLSGRINTDSTFSDTLANRWRVSGQRFPDDSLNSASVSDTAGRKQVSVILAAHDSIITLRYDSSGQAVDTLVFSRANGVFTWVDSSSAGFILEGTVRYYRNALYVNLTRRENGAAASSFSGDFYLDIFTGLGQGRIVPADGASYALNLNIYGTSYLEDRVLETGR
jgi:hypothetical protein